MRAADDAALWRAVEAAKKYAATISASARHSSGDPRAAPDIVTAADLSCWPDAAAAAVYPSHGAHQPFRFLNSGFVAGAASAFVALFAARPPTGDESSGQRYFVDALGAGMANFSLPWIDMDYRMHAVASVNAHSLRRLGVFCGGVTLHHPDQDDDEEWRTENLPKPLLLQLANDKPLVHTVARLVWGGPSGSAEGDSSACVLSPPAAPGRPHSAVPPAVPHPKPPSADAAFCRLFLMAACVDEATGQLCACGAGALRSPRPSLCPPRYVAHRGEFAQELQMALPLAHGAAVAGTLAATRGCGPVQSLYWYSPDHEDNPACLRAWDVPAEAQLRWSVSGGVGPDGSWGHVIGATPPEPPARWWLPPPLKARGLQTRLRVPPGAPDVDAFLRRNAVVLIFNKACTCCCGARGWPQGCLLGRGGRFVVCSERAALLT